MNFIKTALLASLATAMLAGTALAQDKTLNMIVIEGGDTTALQAVADAYTAANPGVKINLQPYPFAQFFQVAELRLRSADAGIDLVYVDAPLLAAYASRGFLSPIEASVDTSSLVESALEAGKYDGTQFALPINNSAQVMFYNKALFQKAGITPPEGLTAGENASQAEVDDLAANKRWTWEQVADAARKMTVSEGGRISTYGWVNRSAPTLWPRTGSPPPAISTAKPGPRAQPSGTTSTTSGMSAPRRSAMAKRHSSSAMASLP
jgi:ABC-type glycerol-3-phosphate transport system substrate-binding protein